MKKSPAKVVAQIKARHRLSLAEKQNLGRALAQAKKRAKGKGREGR